MHGQMFESTRGVGRGEGRTWMRGLTFESGMG